VFYQAFNRARAILVLFLVVALAGVAATSAGAADKKQFNNATLNIRGGDATAVAACINLARGAAKSHKTVQNNFCKNKASASGGDVTLKNVSILIAQDSSRYTSNRATVNIEGGDATAVAACVNVLQGTASAHQTNACANSAVAKGGDVNLKNVDITIIQG
jgi:hypothetical protein